MWSVFKDFIFNLIQFFAQFVGDWGVAIIIVTIIIRVILLPLTIKQMRSMANMSALAPQMKEIQTKYADDPKRQQEAMMEFYANNSFNPLGGCLPLLLQIPVFTALFMVLRDGSNAGIVPDNASFFNILPHLTWYPNEVFSQMGFVPCIPYMVFTILFGVLTIIPMVFMQNNQTGDQARTMKIMGVFMSAMMIYFGWHSPAGVLLYWTVSSAWAVVQQLIINQRKKMQMEAEKPIEVKPLEVNVERKISKPRPKKKR